MHIREHWRDNVVILYFSETGGENLGPVLERITHECPEGQQFVVDLRAVAFKKDEKDEPNGWVIRQLSSLVYVILKILHGQVRFFGANDWLRRSINARFADIPLIFDTEAEALASFQSAPSS